MAQDFTSRLILRCLFNGMEYVGIVMKSNSGSYIADIHDEPQRSDPIYGTFSDFETAEQFVREQWVLKFNLEDKNHSNVPVLSTDIVHMENAQMDLRQKLLHSVYQAHFEDGQKRLEIDFAPVPTEVYMGYQYLADKGLIMMEHKQEEEYYIRMTANGIDMIELELPLRS